MFPSKGSDNDVGNPDSGNPDSGNPDSGNPDSGNPDSGNPRNAEIAIQVGSPAEVDRLPAAFVAAGAERGWPPKDTQMYKKMRFCYVVDPFGMTLDVYCPLSEES